MANLVNELETLILSGIDVRDMTGWPDAMIEDYLNIIRNLARLAAASDSLTGIAITNQVSIESVSAALSRVFSLIDSGNELVHSSGAGVNQLTAIVTAQSKRIDELEQLIAAG